MSSPPDNQADTQAEALEQLLEQPGESLLVRPEYADRISRDWFLPEWWGEAARPVSSGGRGSAWFIRHDTGDWVLRHYSRGGMAARVSQRTYGYLGADRVRSFAEFRLLNHLLRQGLPVPEPVAAYFRRRGPMAYQAAILVKTLPGATPFADYLEQDDPALWRRVGQLVRRFHDAGVDHADLNCHNILVTPEGLFLIDFDKSLIRDGGRRDWRRENLQRLQRSVTKLRRARGLSPAEEAGGWQALIEGYG